MDGPFTNIVKRKIVLGILAAAFAAVFVFSGIQVFIVLREYKEADVVYEQLQKEFVVVAPTQTTEADISMPDQPVVETSGITVDFAKLTARNADVIGWLYCADTPINYPVVQAKDNDKYLHAGLDGKYLRSGTLFVDYRNDAIGEDRQFIVYGHSMKNKTMFGSLMGYKKQEYYEAHPVLYYLTPDAEYRIELFAGCVMKVLQIIYQPNPGTAEYADYLAEMRSKSTFHSDVVVTPEDAVVVLSTCSYEFDNARYVALGKLVKIEK